MNRYKVYGKVFTNKKEAIKYHKKIYGNTNWQASTVYVYAGKELKEVKQLLP